MICTFGDLTDVTWWRELALPDRTIVGRDGRLRAVAWGSRVGIATTPPRPRRLRRARGRTVPQARRASSSCCRGRGRSSASPRPIAHPVKFYERGERPLEIVSSRQWYVRTMRLRDRLLERGRELRWHPAHMRHRYESWVEGLNGDWNISRQRFFGVPFPVWYPVDADGAVDHDRPHPRRARRACRVDPSADVPDGFAEDQRGQPGGFAGDPDVMDTWATSSLTPADRRAVGARPRPVRPGVPHGPAAPGPRDHPHLAVHDDRAQPSSSTGVCRGATRPSRAGCSTPTARRCRSRGATSSTPLPCSRSTAPTPCATGRPAAGPAVDTAFDEGQMKVGRRLAIKILNASRFALSRLGEGRAPGPEAVTAPTRPGHVAAGSARWSSPRPRGASSPTTTPGPWSGPRAFFWSFCDDYLELVKGRAYEDAAERRSRLGPRRPGAGAVGAAAPPGALPPLRDRRGVVVVARRLDPPGAVARGRRARPRGPAPARTPSSTSWPGYWARSGGPRPGPRCPCAPGWRR